MEDPKNKFDDYIVIGQLRDKLEIQASPRFQKYLDNLSLVFQYLLENPNHNIFNDLTQKTSPIELRSPPPTNGFQPPMNEPTQMFTIDLQNKFSMNEQYKMYFNLLQQIVCKEIAKLWIKVIEPKKQTKFPYKGGNSTKPSWWPDEVPHREPDHLNKSDRITLLITICHLDVTYLQDLYKSTQSVDFTPEKRELYNELFYLLYKEFDFQRLKTDSKVMVSLFSRKQKRLNKSRCAKGQPRRRSISKLPPKKTPDENLQMAKLLYEHLNLTANPDNPSSINDIDITNEYLVSSAPSHSNVNFNNSFALGLNESNDLPDQMDHYSIYNKSPILPIDKQPNISL
ncbi:BA75_00373T0 [Komagataella pastoris]|uniref:BA75_00373T0 n=1 Tax=Komagataella pastoris TaxID=4922 RepID=A0A1B2J879_PICPA|nr:BA75_00373T0 [Komagataella pastoris]